LGESAAVVDVLDEEGRVVGVVTRAEVRASNLRHRSVYVVLRSTSGDVLVHRRADWKDIFPGRWDMAFGGVVDSGEEPEAAARRELLEEAGVEVPLTPMGVASYADADADADADLDVEGHLFAATSDGPFTFADGEVVEVRWVPVAELAAWLVSRRTCPDSETLVLPLLTAT